MLPEEVAFRSDVTRYSFRLITTPVLEGLCISNVGDVETSGRRATLTLATCSGYGFSSLATLAMKVLAEVRSGSGGRTSVALCVSRTPAG